MAKGAWHKVIPGYYSKDGYEIIRIKRNNKSKKHEISTCYLFHLGVTVAKTKTIHEAKAIAC